MASEIHVWFRPLIWLMVWWPGGWLGAQTCQPAEQEAHPYLCFEVEAIARLEGGWQLQQAEGAITRARVETVPFELQGPGELTFIYDWQVPGALPDSFYLYFGGLAWYAELELNAQYLGWQQHPFEPWAVKVRKRWLSEGENRFVLRLRQGAGLPGYPAPFLGIFRPVYVLSAAQLAQVQVPLLPHLLMGDTVALLAPYFREQGYHFDAFEAMRSLLPMLQNGQRLIHFPFPPGRQFEAFCAEWGLIVVDSLAPQTVVMPLNEYPFDPHVQAGTPPYWVDREGRRSLQYGQTYLAGEPPAAPPVKEPGGALLGMVLLPLLSLFTLKVLAPGVFYAQKGMLLQPQLYLDSSGEASAGGSQSLVYILVGLKWLSLSSFLAMVFEEVDRQNHWSWLNVFSEQSLANSLMPQQETLLSKWIWLVALIGVGLLLRQLLLWMLGQIFRFKGLAQEMLVLDVMSTYPLVLWLPLPAALMLFADPARDIWLGIGLLGLFVAYFLRQLFLWYVGLGRLFSFSPAMKILYICTFNILPYIVWF